ncbi:5503_t:CDS:1 [Dentiscutata heterogama]|uniref:5503_t:CDS:1 n=1 Tax=Dentiscutata heterogama TaxID=1316150 RepID=A0ACA9MFQ9_9GLOM|nr:5503_t:CDS:1 [Dentiscutata heterogama]
MAPIQQVRSQPLMSSSQQTKTQSMFNPNQLQLTSSGQQTKTLILSPPLSPTRPISPTIPLSPQKSIPSITPSRTLSPQLNKSQSMFPQSLSPPLSPRKPTQSLSKQRSLPSFRSVQSQPLPPQLQQVRDSQPPSPTQELENPNMNSSIYNNNTNNSSSQKLQIHTSPDPKSNKSDESLSPIIETLSPMSKKTSFALLTRADLALIAGWIDGLDLSSPEDASYAVTDVPYKFKLLARGSRHGFSDKVFHKRCDNKGPTITVIKLKDVNDMVIGGYNPVKWQSPLMRKFEKCHHSFVFSLKTNGDDKDSANTKEMQDDEILETSLASKYNISNRNLIINTTPFKHESSFGRVSYSKYAINLSKSTGPAFGTTDLIMKDGEVKCKPDCYSLDLLKKIDGETDTFDNVKSYRIEEYEVYLLLKRK